MNTSKAKNEGSNMKERVKGVQLAAPFAPGEQSLSTGSGKIDENKNGMGTSKGKEKGDAKERAKSVQLAAPSAPGEQSLFNMVAADEFDESKKKNRIHTSEAKEEERSAKERSKGVELAPPFDPSHSLFNVTAEIDEKSVGHAIERPIDREDHNSDMSNTGGDKETKPHLVNVVSLAPNYCIEEEQQLLAIGSNSDAVADTNAPATLVEADLAPELMAAEEVNIQDEEEMINKKIEYRRILWFAMVSYGAAIICIATTFVLLFISPGLIDGPVYDTFSNALMPAACLLFIAVILIFLPTRRRCSAAISFDEYAPDDKLFLRDAQITSAGSFCLFSSVAIPIIVLLPNLQWLGFTLTTCVFAGTVFAFLRVWLLLRPKETRQEKSKAFWAVFVAFFIALGGAAVWRCLNPIYPDCVVENPNYIGDGWCDGGVYNTEECGYDGGDCANEKYPDCHADNPSKIGDGTCDGGSYMTAECGNDGGDCLAFLDKYPGCIVDQPHRIGDGFCDLCYFEPYTSPRALSGTASDRVHIPVACTSGAYNTKACGYDGGDCDAVNKWYPELYPDCHVEKRSRIGDGMCDGRLYGTEECGFDGGDCLKAGERCRGHLECASEVCNFDTKVCDSS